MNAKVTISLDTTHVKLMKNFESFAKLVLDVDIANPTLVIDVKLYRSGVTNAANRGIDIWANFGPIVQVKHLTFTDDLAERTVCEVTADRIIIVCKVSEKDAISRALEQLGQSPSYYYSDPIN